VKPATEAEPAGPPGWIAQASRHLLILSLPLVPLCLLAPTSGWWFAGEMAASAALHAAILLLPALIVWRRSIWIGGGLLLTIICGAMPSLLAAWEPRAPTAANGTSLRVACANTYLYNDRAVRPAAIAAALTGTPDIVVLAESIASVDRPLVSLEAYPYQLWQPQLRRKWRDSVVLLSRHPIITSTVHDADTQPFLHAEIDVAGKTLHVIAVHTMSPVSPSKLSERNAQLADIGELVAGLNGPVLLLGDCNLTVASSAWRTLRDRSGLLRAAQTEPSTWPDVFGPFGITIDHIVGRDLALGPQASFDIPGSDHRGLRGTIAW
jgi:endonuclease/exonuclease/phosphatase (EEP) superfamily protein YafD